jgi:uncharacterized HAD superfamily protein
MVQDYLVIDIDNVVAETDEVMRDVIKKHSKDRVDLQYEDVTAFDYDKCVDREGRCLQEGEWTSIHTEFSREVNITRIRPYPNVGKYLQTLSEAGHAIHLVTSRLAQARLSTVTWLEQHKIPHDGLHFVKHRCKHFLFQNCAGVIEDDLDQAVDFARLGIPAYLLAHPWNETGINRGLTRVKDWRELVEVLLSKKRTQG